MTTRAKNFQPAHPLLWGLLVSALATAANWLLPRTHAGEAVGLVFLVGTALLALRHDAPDPPEHFGLSFGGLMSDAPLDLRRMLRESLRAIGIAIAVACVVLPPFALGFLWWFAPQADFSWSAALRSEGAGSQVPGFGIPAPVMGLVHLVLGHLLVVALPEEVFFRGYLQTRLNDRWTGRLHLAGTTFGWGLIASSALFAAGHLATTLDVGRLAVFFPSLLFGLVRERTGGVGASIVLHAICNVFSTLLGQGYRLY